MEDAASSVRMFDLFIACIAGIMAEAMILAIITHDRAGELETSWGIQRVKITSWGTFCSVEIILRLNHEVLLNI